MGRIWDSVIRRVGKQGHDWVFPPEGGGIAKKCGFKAPLEEFIDKLRSGEDMPASAAVILAEIIEGQWSYKLELVPVKKNIRACEQGADSIGIGLEIEGLVRDQRITINASVERLAEILSVDSRTIWRHWRRYKAMYPREFFPDGFLQEFERMSERSLKAEEIPGTNKSTDKK